MHGKFGLLSAGKASSHTSDSSDTKLLLLFLFFMCAVFSCFHTTGCEAYSFTTDGYGIFNVRTNVGTYRTHEGGCLLKASSWEEKEKEKKAYSPANRTGSPQERPGGSAQELTRRDKTTSVSLPAPPGDRTCRVFVFEFRLSI